MDHKLQLTRLSGEDTYYHRQEIIDLEWTPPLTITKPDIGRLISDMIQRFVKTFGE
jgi:hypothetical protein